MSSRDEGEKQGKLETEKHGVEGWNLSYRKSMLTSQVDAAKFLERRATGFEKFKE